MTLAEIDVGDLVELIWIAPVAAVLVTATFSACVLGATRATDARRVGDGRAAAAWMALALLAGLLALAQVVAGIGVIVVG